MTAHFPVLLRLAITLLVFAGSAYLAFGTELMWIAVSIVLACWYTVQLFYLSRLSAWLENPQTDLRGTGIWDNIFNKLLNQTKKSAKRKKDIVATLERFNRVTEAIPNGLLILNREGRLEWFNQLAAQHLNLHSEEDRHNILQNIIRLPDFQRFLQKKLSAQPLQIKISLPNGEFLPRTISITRFPFETYNELLITQDISDKEQLNASQTAFVANVSHELRTPLTVINGFLETLNDHPDLPHTQRAQFITLMQKEGQRMLSVLADLLMFSRLEKGATPDSDDCPFDLSDLVTQIAQESRNLSKEQHCFFLHIDPHLQFNGIQNELHSALSNIAFNAVRYTPENGEIRISLKKINEKQALFEVRDTGVGIAAEHLPRLTERFYRVDNSRSRQSGGTGLGLAITKFALAKYDCRLEIESAVGKGSVFSVKLPLYIA